MSEDDGSWQSLHRDTLKVTAIVVAGVAVGAGVPTAVGIGSATSDGVALAWVLPGMLLLVAGAVLLDYLRWRHTRYRVTDHLMELRKGVVMTTRRSLARERIRTVDLSANPVLRVFGLVKVNIGTGDGRSGGGSSPTEQTIVLDPVGRAAGERLRADLLDRARRADDPDGSTLATWDPFWIRYAPLSFWTFALAAFAVGAMFQVLDWFGRGGLPVEVVMDIAEDIGAWSTLGLALGVFVTAGVVGTLAVYVEGWWNYRLEREPGGTLRVRRGLLTTRSVSLEEQRIRGVQIVEPLGVRSAGAARVDVVTTGLKNDPTSDLSTLLPAAPRPLAARITAQVAGVDAEPSLRPHPRSARVRRLRWAVVADIVLVAIVVLLAAATPLPGFWVAVFSIVAALTCAGAVAAAVDAYRALGHRLDAHYLVARQGSVRRATVFLQRQGIIGWRISQSVFQRRAGLITVTATTAAGARRYSIIDADEHEILDVAAEAVPDLLDPFLIRD
ncbi:PH domain-containing protein [Jiangella asiatica]|uniref:YdbS-like PH domain-containing protein n=1 Tax=Jiangella asiatica TaxID=2530372 RepID=A0A4R5D4G8_9ACTN|nr:PH domain-containing protein [Jiangella asiatica]TDE07367.1 hypothetical protein E1269_20000 [Jiangella asiatica]